MAVTKKRGRPVGSKNKPKDPMIEAVEKRHGRPAGTRIKHRQTVESVRKAWEEKYGFLAQQYDHILDVGGREVLSLKKELELARNTVINQATIIGYLENKVEQLIAHSIRGN